MLSVSAVPIRTLKLVTFFHNNFTFCALHEIPALYNISATYFSMPKVIDHGKLSSFVNIYNIPVQCKLPGCLS